MVETGQNKTENEQVDMEKTKDGIVEMILRDKDATGKGIENLIAEAIKQLPEKIRAKLNPDDEIFLIKKFDGVLVGKNLKGDQLLIFVRRENILYII